MEKPVIISIRGVQTTAPGEEDVMELVTQGVLGGDERELTLTYRESELTGLEGTTTTFRIAGDKITLTREGTLNSEMVFQEGKDHVSLYETPYGGLTLGVKTRKARSGLSLSPAGGDLEIAYALDVDDQRIGENSFFIQVREPDGASVQLL